MQSEIPQDDQKEINIQQILLQNSVFMITGEITNDLSDQFSRWLIAENLNYKGEARELTIFINSQGGDLYEAWAMIDLMKTSPHKIKTVAVGSCMSAALLVFSQGSLGLRFAGSNTSFMSHQHTDTIESVKHHDLNSYARESGRNNLKMIQQLTLHTNLTDRQLKKTLLAETDYYFTTEEAIKIGLVDHEL